MQTRSHEQQVKIGRYTQTMAGLWVRVKSAVSQTIFAKFIAELRAVEGKVEQAARWTVQKTFPKYPVFVGPCVWTLFSLVLRLPNRVITIRWAT